MTTAKEWDGHYFQVDRTPQPSATLRRILRIYDRMQEVFKRPGGVFGSAMFETNPFPDMDKKASAWTTGGGFDLIGQLRPRPEPAARADRIYLCSQVATRSRQANIMHRHQGAVSTLIAPAGRS